MRLTIHTDYSLRVLMYLNQSQELMTLSDLSKTLRISRNSLIKVSSHLASQGWIQTTRGKEGGLRIHPRAGKLSLKDIVTQTEENFHMAECFKDKKSSCPFSKDCHLRHAMRSAIRAFLDSLGRVTLDDLKKS